MTLEEFKTEYPDIAKALAEEGRKVGLDEADSIEAATEEALVTAGIKGAKEERERIQSVRDQLIPGHEALIETLMFDGETSGPEAAVKIINAEKSLRAKTLTDTRADAPQPLPDPSTDGDDPATTPDAKNLPVDERAKLSWDKDVRLRDEFAGDFDVYLAYEQAKDKGLVKIQRGNHDAS